MKHTLITKNMIDVLGNELKNDPTLRVECGKDLFFFDLGTFEANSKEYLRTAALGISHFHMDHIRCLDTLICLSMETQATVSVVGPVRTAEKLACRIRSFELNLINDSWAAFRVIEIAQGGLSGFDVLFPSGDIVAVNDISLPSGMSVAVLDHGTSSLAFALKEEDSTPVDVAKLQALGVSPGPWLQEAIRLFRDGIQEYVVDGEALKLDAFISWKKGEKILYATDFAFSEANITALEKIGAGVDVLYCEAMYRSEDAELAEKNWHLTDDQAEEVARRLAAQKLVKFHQSFRYSKVVTEDGHADG